MTATTLSTTQVQATSVDATTFLPSKQGRNVLTTAECLQNESLYSLEGMPSYPVVMTRGQGSLLWDLEGKRYIDFNAGLGACNQGHCHPQVVQAMAEQCPLLTIPSRAAHVQQYGEFCKKICEITGYDKVGLGNAGAEAVDLAVKIARSWGYKTKGIAADKAIVLTAVSNYHGRTLSLLSGSSNEAYRSNCGPWMPNIGPYCAGNTVRFGVIGDLEEAFAAKGSEIAAFLIEPVQGQTGCLPATDEYLIQARKLCTQYNVLFIADEIQSGMGRSGKMFSYESAGIKPDMVVVGKSLSGGVYPISAVIGTKQVMNSITGDQYGSTFTGNPLACAVGIAALNVIVTEKLAARAAAMGKIFEQRCQAIKSPYIDCVTGKGLFRSIWIHENHPRGLVTAKRVAELCIKRGLFLTASGRRLRTCPALTIEESLMVEGLDILEKALVDSESIENI